MPIDLTALGWSPHFEEAFAAQAEPGLLCGRVCREDRERYAVLTAAGECHARLAGSYRFRLADRCALPVVGDWVALRTPAAAGDASIQALLPRRSQFSRKAVLAGGPQYGPGRTAVQVLAANFDVVLLVNGLDQDFNPRRIERYLAAAWESGAEPIVVLNKADVCPDPEAARSAVLAGSAGIAVHVVSAMRGDGLAAIRERLGHGCTGVLLGSSGVGKSTLINRLLGNERQAVRAVRAHDGRGRHTTVARELIRLPGGGLLIDTPGLRELQAWEDAGGLAEVFADVEGLARACRFRDCRHESEPGCAVQGAITGGHLDAQRLRNYRKLQRELAQLAVRKEQRARQGAGKRQMRWSRRGRRGELGE